ncbi:hypothetical protein GCM10023189_56250 [Nibrella saemangeumensis]|uniref:HTH LytTR-type domain-containing protein n=1 Tax=Nibrella saemangeumensis TaxID=1084526 RepID=A0ABP8NPN3_9BACT
MRPFTHRQNLIARLIAVPVAALTASHVVFYRRFPWQADYQFPWPYFLTVATVMLSCWEMNLAIFRYLDQRLPFHKNPVQRILRQILYGGLLTMLTFALVFPCAIRLYTGQWPSPDLFVTGMFVCATIATIGNGAYVGLYLLQTIYLENQQPAESLTQQLSQLPSLPPRTHSLLVDAGARQLQLPFDQIAYFYSSGGVVLLVKTNGQQIMTSYNSFAKLEDRLPADAFFQLSRQFIVSLPAIRAVEDDENRKLLVLLTPALRRSDPHETVTVSRYRSAEFKKWFRQVATA